jgi:DNA polymerase-3 subunit epsilon
VLGAPTFAIVDVETTGLAPKQDRVLELAIVRLDAQGALVDEWVTRFNPEGPVGATHIHGITAADVAHAPLFRDLAVDVTARLTGTVVAAHNARFDLAFLHAEFTRAGWSLPWLPSFCTLEASAHYLPYLDRRRLADCCAASGVRLDGVHSALGDARATAGLVYCYLHGLGGAPVLGDLLTLPDEARRVAWPSGPERAPQTTTAPAMRPHRWTAARPKEQPLLTQLRALSLAEVLDGGAPEGAVGYLELLLDVVEDGVITPQESAALADVATLYDLSYDDCATTHRAFLTALAHLALDDGHVSRAEREELHRLAELLDVPRQQVQRLLDHADDARAARMSEGITPLPDDWPLGEPLRVGDKIVFTGCDDAQRERLEKRAERLGVRVAGNVSRFTAMLVTDGSFDGTKAAKARELGTRVVHPDTLGVLLDYLQPAVPRKPAVLPPTAIAAEPAVVGSDVPRPAPAPTSPSGASPSAIRAWAMANGHAVGVRGRLPREIVDAYAAAHTAEPATPE